MSPDEEATIVGRMVLDRNRLIKLGALLNEELTRTGVRLSSLGDQLKSTCPPYVGDTIQLTDEHYALLDASKIARLLTEAAEVAKDSKTSTRAWIA